jgi:HAD superfamily hydrolase (TIGR01549 family)
VRWVVFDVGETLIDESRLWGEWADLLDVPRFTLAAALGAVIARGEDHRRVFDLVAPGVDWRALQATRAPFSPPERIEAGDLYPDVRGGLAAIRSAGFLIGIAGNQPTTSERALERLGLPFDLVASSETFGATKPDSRFFERLLEATGGPASEVAYVGDRIDNDVTPALRAGMCGILLRRGPWPIIGAAMYPLEPGTLVVDSLEGLLDVLAPIDPAAVRRADG